MSDGKINVEGAGDYRIIFLRDSDQMLLSTAQRLKELVSQGAVILGDKPVKSPSLMDDEEDEKELRKIADELWGESPGGFNQFGKGRVYWGKSLMEVLNSENIPPDVIVANELPLSWIHRKTDDADIYFISSTCPDPLDLSISFKLENTYPEIWDPFTGAQSLARVWSKDKERINVSVSFAPSGSAILVFPKGKKEPEYTKVEFNEHTILDTKTSWYRMHHNPDSIPTLVLTENAVLASQSGIYSFTKEDKTIEKQMLDVHEKLLNDNWILRFEEGWDAPSSYNMLMIKPLTEIKDKAIRHYSGTVTYTKEISYTKNDKQVYIDLGNVANIADFWCNGEKIGVRWAPPFTFDLTGKLKEGKNLLEIKVTNTWRNQLIYDNSRTEAEKKTCTTNPPRKDEKELELSGLSGPVRLITY